MDRRSVNLSRRHANAGRPRNDLRPTRHFNASGPREPPEFQDVNVGIGNTAKDERNNLMRKAIFFVAALLALPTFAVAGDHQDRDREVSVKETIDTGLPADQDTTVESGGTAASETVGIDDEAEDALRDRAKKQGGLTGGSE